jgi:hypothetical protein
MGEHEHAGAIAEVWRWESPTTEHRIRIAPRRFTPTAGARWSLASAANATLLCVTLLSIALVVIACGEEPSAPTASGTFGGQVVVSGPLRKAAVSIDQIDLQAKGALVVRDHIADTNTDDEGRFRVEVGKFNGLFLVTARGGSFTDLATGATIQLDPTASLESFTWFELFDERDDVLVSPVGQLIATRTRAKLVELPDIQAAQQDAAEQLNRHFGAVDWTQVKPASLDTAATSPTEPVRAALVQAALSFLAHDIAEAAGESPQVVNVLTLTQQLAADLEQGGFDGNDGNSPTFGAGLQLGVCSPVSSCGAPPGASCALGACRPLCDLYAGTPRTLLAGEMTKVIQSMSINRTGLVTGDILAVARSIADNVDEDVFGSACIENLDRIPPTLEFLAPVTQPGVALYVRGMLPVRVHAVDDTDQMPQVRIDGGAPTSSTAEAVINTTDINGPLVITASARDLAGNVDMRELSNVIADNIAPAVTLANTGFFVDGGTWWTASPTPELHGTITDASPVTVAAASSAGIVEAVVTGSTWTGSAPGTLDLAGSDVTIIATDAAGNQAQRIQRIRADTTPPQLLLQTSKVNDEANEVPTFDADEAPVHQHTGAEIDLADASRCPSVTKFSYLLTAESPLYGSEIDDRGSVRRNPLRYLIVAADNGVGIDMQSMQYRVGLRSTNGTTWILDWTAANAPEHQGPGLDLYDIRIVADVIPQLATTQGTYDVEFKVTDRLNRATVAMRCFDLRLRAPPLHFQRPGEPGNPVPQEHTYRLTSLSLTQGTPFRLIAARLLNDKRYRCIDYRRRCNQRNCKHRLSGRWYRRPRHGVGVARFSTHELRKPQERHGQLHSGS